METRRLFAAALTLVGLTPGATIAGDVSIQAVPTSQGVGASDVTSIRYTMNGQVLSTPIPSGATLDWQTGRVWDGPAVFKAFGLTDDGRVVAESEPVPVTIDNGPGSIRVVGPDLAGTHQGDVRLIVESKLELTDADRQVRRSRGIADNASSIAFVIFYVDGTETSATYNSERSTFDLDTTRLANGVHDLIFTAYGNVTGDNAVASTRVQITVDNGKTLRDARPAYRELFLKPGETARLAPRQVFTDNSVAPITTGATFVSSNPAVASVDATGTVRAVAPGTTTVTTAALGFSNTTEVTVRTVATFAHLSKDGQTLTSYDPGRSTFVRTLFNLGPDQIATTPGLAEAVKDAGINALTSGFYQNPVYTGSPDLAAWKRGYDQMWGRVESIAKQQGFNLVLIGDDLARTAAELNNSINNAWSDDAIQYALSKARDSGIATSIEMVDETDYLWGDSPTPTDNRWVGKSPAIAADSIARLMKIINAVPNRPSITWPVAGRRGDTPAKNWMGNPAFSDHATIYWDLTQRYASPLGATLSQFGQDIEAFAKARNADLPEGTPTMFLTSASGIFYRTKSGGGAYKPGVDEMIAPNVGPGPVALSIMNAAALGASGVRTYGYDGHWQKERDSVQPNGKELQTGVDPFDTGLRRWAAMSAAFNTIAQLEPHLLQPKMNAVDLGAKVVTSARQGPDSRLLIAVNNSDIAQSPVIDLSPYAYAGGTVTVYRVAGKNATSTDMTIEAASKLTLSAGQSIVWLFKPAASAPTLRTSSSSSFYGPLPYPAAEQNTFARAGLFATSGVTIGESVLNG